MARRKKYSEPSCEWRPDGEYDYYDTDCGQAFTLFDETPAENKMKFCCYCGRPLKANFKTTRFE